MADSVHYNAARERSAIGVAYVGIERSLKRFISRLGANASDVDDIAQEALLNAMRAEADRVIDNPKAYLYRVAHNLAVKTHSQKSREIIGYVEALGVAEAPCPAPSAERQIIDREQLAILCDALATLPPACRRVFIMRKVYGWSHKEISDKLGISTSTVEKHLATGLARCVTFMRSREEDGAGPANPADTEQGRTAAELRRELYETCC
jgi:RNA polymerase sigma-70 factor (ECF subfamily)